MSDERTVIFLYGADMDPEALHRALPDGRFVARARVPAASLPAPLPGGGAAPDVWGILIETTPTPPDQADEATTPATPGAAGHREVCREDTGPNIATTDDARATTVTATTDDTRAITATPSTSPAALTDPAATIAAARYWELPPAYIATITPPP